MLQQIFQQLLDNYTTNQLLITELWTEIEQQYTHRKRHYHNLQHLENMLQQLMAVKSQILHWEQVLISLYYHDIIYSALKQDNEERSAALAAARMQQLAIGKTNIEACTAQILATKAHAVAADSDTNYFTDADLSILGQSWDTYTAYYKNVRKEYAIYPDFVYGPGRKKVLAHFLSMERIFKTAFFYETFEVQARQNLQHELELLSA